MSAPATNARPAPGEDRRRRRRRVRATSSIASPSSAIVASFSALSLSGRLTVIVATRSDDARVSVFVGHGGEVGLTAQSRRPRTRTDSCLSSASEWPTLDSPSRTQTHGFRYVDADGRRRARPAHARRASTRCAFRRRGATCTSRRTPRRDSGVGLRRARAKAVSLSRARGRARRAAEVPSRATAREGARPAGDPHGADARRARAPTGSTHDAVAATVLRLISETFCRVGSERYAKENGTFGITTLRKSHVDVADDRAQFDYRGKGAIRQRQVVDRSPSSFTSFDAQLTNTGRATLSLSRRRTLASISRARDVNEYLRDAGRRVHREGLSHLGRNAARGDRARRARARRAATEAKRNVALAMRLVASELGNTPAICRTSYVHPIVIARYLDDGETIALPRSRARRRTADGAFAGGASADRVSRRHFPERRRRQRASVASRARSRREISLGRRLTIA